MHLIATLKARLWVEYKKAKQVWIGSRGPGPYVCLI